MWTPISQKPPDFEAVLVAIYSKLHEAYLFRVMYIRSFDDGGIQWYDDFSTDEFFERKDLQVKFWQPIDIPPVV